MYDDLFDFETNFCVEEKIYLVDEFKIGLHLLLFLWIEIQFE